ncbi:hypothetical protein [Salmonirosea aquatica]|uniref:Uncharacterized protein n=1 Tax=Salmonirosea aquatica TaxID=2654236 RepID=A0A7C9F321_9BACT|nr:hypothetical protein [Cytophagaceae bacterium SJW1-29]
MLKNPTFAAVFSTAYLLLFVVLIAVGQAGVGTLLFIFSPLLIIWLVYVVLRYGKASGRTFDEYFYDDVNIRVDKLRE